MTPEEAMEALEVIEGEYDLEKVRRLFHPLGYTKEAEEIEKKTRKFVESILKEYPHVDTNDLILVIDNAADMELVFFCHYRRFLSKQVKELREKKNSGC